MKAVRLSFAAFTFAALLTLVIYGFAALLWVIFKVIDWLFVRGIPLNGGQAGL